MLGHSHYFSNTIVKKEIWRENMIRIWDTYTQTKQDHKLLRWCPVVILSYFLPNNCLNYMFVNFDQYALDIAAYSWQIFGFHSIGSFYRSFLLKSNYRHNLVYANSFFFSSKFVTTVVSC